MLLLERKRDSDEYGLSEILKNIEVRGFLLQMRSHVPETHLLPNTVSIASDSISRHISTVVCASLLQRFLPLLHPVQVLQQPTLILHLSAVVPMIVVPMTLRDN